jgi:hypothetical protein
MKKIMKASEARNRALQVNTDSKNSQFAKIILEIEHAVSQGKYEIWFYDTILDDVRKKLTEFGYLVAETQFERNETMTKITW